jgi:hypothetical protein
MRRRRFAFFASQQTIRQRVIYSYDINPIDGNYSQYAWSRMTAATFQMQTDSGSQFSSLYSYNQAGRVVPT